jgi:hypothetical protein
MKRNLIAVLILVTIPYTAATANCLWGNQWYPVGYLLRLQDGSRIQCLPNGTWVPVR